MLRVKRRRHPDAVELSELAESDLLDIALYIAEDTPDRAFSFVDELQQSCDGLADQPLRFPLLPGFEEEDIRRRVHGRYAIIYAVDPALVRVLRIVSAAMDMNRILGS